MGDDGRPSAGADDIVVSDREGVNGNIHVNGFLAEAENGRLIYGNSAGSSGDGFRTYKSRKSAGSSGDSFRTYKRRKYSPAEANGKLSGNSATQSKKKV